MSQQEPCPPWWTADDTRICVAALHQIEDGGAWRSNTRAGRLTGPYVCRRCQFWRSRSGERGRCTMPETLSTVNCGPTDAAELCEQ